MAKYVPDEQERADVAREYEEAMKSGNTKKLKEVRAKIERLKENKDHGYLEKTLGRWR